MIRCGAGVARGLVSLQGGCCRQTGLPLLVQRLGHQYAGGTLQPSVADQQQGHRSRSSLESQPNPTTPIAQAAQQAPGAVTFALAGASTTAAQHAPAPVAAWRGLPVTAAPAARGRGWSYPAVDPCCSAVPPGR